MGRLKLDFHTVVSDGPVEVRWKHHEKRRDDGQQRDARHRDHKSSQDVLGHLRSDGVVTRADELTDAGTNAVVPVHPLLHKHVALEHDERQHRDRHKYHESSDIK